MTLRNTSAWVALGVLAVVPCAACGSIGIVTPSSDGGAGDGSTAGSAGRTTPGAGGAPANGGSTASSGGSGGDPSICHASNLSSAPLPCLADFTHVKAKYAADCVATGGYQAHCDPYDALVFHSAGTYTWCWYDTGTGNLIGARETTDAAGTGGTCVSFDLGFMEPNIASCAPAGAACTP